MPRRPSKPRVIVNQLDKRGQGVLQRDELSIEEIANRIKAAMAAHDPPLIQADVVRWIKQNYDTKKINVQRQMSRILNATQWNGLHSLLRPLEELLGIDLRPNSTKSPYLDKRVDKNVTEASNYGAAGIERPFFNTIRWREGAHLLELAEPRALSGAPEATAYGFRYSGSDMAPAIRDGWTVWVGSEVVEPTPGDIIVLERSDRDSPERYIVFFVGTIDTEWVVAKTTGDEFRLSRSDWPIARDVVVHASYSRR